MAHERLGYDDKEIPLTEGMHYIGRGADCLVRLDDAMVSRRHARLVVGGGVVTIEDCGSANGTQINRTRLRGAIPLSHGDHIELGTTRLVFRRSARSESVTRPDLPESLRGTPGFGDEPSTLRWDLLASFCVTADESLEAGDAKAAEAVLRAPLRQLLDDAWRGRYTEPSVKERAVRSAARLAWALRDVAWIDYVVDLHRAAGGSLPPALVDEVTAVAERLGILPHRSSSYVAQLREPVLRETTPVTSRSGAS